METKSDTLQLFNKLKSQKKVEDIKSAYYYACPRRYPDNKKVVENLTDSTAITSVNDAVKSMHNSIYPPFRQWIVLVAETPIPPSEENRFKKWVAEAERKMSLAVELSNFHTEIDDTLTDAMISEGALLLHEGSDENPFIFESVPWDRFFSKLSFDKRPETNFYWRTASFNEIKYRWPNAKGLDVLGSPKGSDLFEIVEATIYDDFKDTYRYEVWLKDKNFCIYQEDGLDSSPWNIYRMGKQMYSDVGYGPVREVLPDIKTLDRTQELVLKNAAFAISGLWQADDDGVINPRTIKIVPGGIIPKSAGSKGLQPLETNRNFDVSQIVIADKSDKITKAIQGDKLPDASDGVRTAYEYSTRKEQAAKIEIPTVLRLAQPNAQLGKRMFAILSSPGKQGSPFYIEPFKYSLEGEFEEILVKVKMANPLIDLQKEIDKSKELQTLGNAMQLFGDLPLRMIQRPEYVRDYMVDNGFPVSRMRELDKVQEELAAEQQAINEAKGRALAEEENKNAKR